MVIDIMLTPLSMFTSSYRATVSPSRLHRGMRLVHAKRPPRQRLSPSPPTTQDPRRWPEARTKSHRLLDVNPAGQARLVIRLQYPTKCGAELVNRTPSAATSEFSHGEA
jgi:hypothetical protein